MFISVSFNPFVVFFVDIQNMFKNCPEMFNIKHI